MAGPRKNKPKKNKNSNRSSTTASMATSSTTSAADLPPLSPSDIIKLLSGCAERISHFSNALKLGFQQVLQIVQSVDLQCHWLLDSELSDVIFILRSCTEWLSKRYKSIADILDDLLLLEPGEGPVTTADFTSGDNYAAIEKQVMSTTYVSVTNQRRRDHRRRRRRSECAVATAFPRQIQEDKVETMLEELNVAICVLTMLAEEMENLGSQIKPVLFREQLDRQAQPLTKFIIDMYKNAEELLLRRGIREEGGDFSSELSDEDEFLNEVWIASTMDHFRASWAAFKQLYLHT